MTVPTPGTPPKRGSPEYATALATSMRWDTERDEPYLELPSFPDLRVVPWRAGAEHDVAALYSHPLVGVWSYFAPYPMSIEYAAAQSAREISAAAKLISELRSTLPLDTSTPLSPPPGSPAVQGCPLRLIVTSQGRVVGQVGVRPNTEGIADDRTPTTPEEMKSRPLPDQIWDLGYALHPDYWGRGVVTEAVKCLLESWVRPWMRIGTVSAFYTASNAASCAVLERCGLKTVYRGSGPWPEDKGGGMNEYGIAVLGML